MTTTIIGDIALIKSDTPIITDAQSALDLIASLFYEQQITKIAINKAAVSEDFFKLSTGLAGDVVQKFVNYRCRLVIIGDFSGYTSKPVKVPYVDGNPFLQGLLYTDGYLHVYHGHCKKTLKGSNSWTVNRDIAEFSIQKLNIIILGWSARGLTGN